MSDMIFMSYDRSDVDRAQVVARSLERAGFAVWWDRNLKAGERFERSISSALASAKCVIVLWSKASISSDWVRDEAAEGAKRGLLVPVLIDDVEIPLGFRQFHAARVIGLDSSGTADLTEVMRAVDSVVNRQSPVETPAGRTSDTAGTDQRAGPAPTGTDSSASVKVPRSLWVCAVGIGLALASVGAIRLVLRQTSVTVPDASPAESVLPSPQPPVAGQGTIRGDSAAGMVEFRWPGNDCWQVYRGVELVAGGTLPLCGSSKQTLEAGTSTVKSRFDAPFAPFETTIRSGSTTTVTIGGTLDFRWPGNDCWEPRRNLLLASLRSDERRDERTSD